MLQIFFPSALSRCDSDSAGVLGDFEFTLPLKQAFLGRNVPGASEGGLSSLNSIKAGIIVRSGAQKMNQVSCKAAARQTLHLELFIMELAFMLLKHVHWSFLIQKRCIVFVRQMIQQFIQ